MQEIIIKIKLGITGKCLTFSKPGRTLVWRTKNIRRWDCYLRSAVQVNPVFIQNNCIIWRLLFLALAHESYFLHIVTGLMDASMIWQWWVYQLKFSPLGIDPGKVMCESVSSPKPIIASLQPTFTQTCSLPANSQLLYWCWAALFWVEVSLPCEIVTLIKWLL